MKRILLLHLVLLLCNGLCNAQTNSIDIGSANQNINPATTFNAWTVFAEGPDMQSSLCFNDGSGRGNTSGPPGSAPSSATLPILTQGPATKAYLLTTFPGWPAGSYLSCFNGNTIYNPIPGSTDATFGIFHYNISSCSMTIRRKFLICSSTTQTVNFSINVTADNYLNTIIVDADSTSPVIIYNTGAFSLPGVGPINGNATLAPGIHTIDIKCSDAEDQNTSYGIWYLFPSGQHEWNPFGVAITGNITTAGNVLLNTASIPAVSAITGNSNTCANSTTSLSDATAGGNWSSSNTAIATVSAAGVVTGIAPGNVVISYTVGTGPCSNIATQNLTVTNCTPALCTGTLGAPIVNITFGSGSSNPGPQLSAAVPGATTTYTFASYAVGNPPFPPPNDGYYELANVVPFNSAWFTGAPDHTGNTNGYMAMFNASPSPGEFYRQTVTSLCPGTTYEFAAWIANVVDPAILPGAILPNITFNILDPTTNAVLASYNSGDIAMSSSMTWKQYGSLFTMPAGLSSIILVLSNNNIGGGAQPGNDLVIDDITFRPCGPTTIAALDKDSICQGNNVTLEGNVSGGLHNPAYQWQISTDGGVTFVDIPGATTLNYTESGLTQGTYQFQLLSAEAVNISTATCRFVSNIVTLKVGSSSIAVNAGNDSLICKNSSFALSGSGTNIVQYAWTPKTYLSDSTLQNPTATITATTKFYLAATNAAGCTAVDSVTMTVQNLPVKTNNDTAVCAGNTIQLNTNGANSYSWSPSTGLTNTGIANPVDTSTAANTIQYIVKGTSTIGCSANDTVNITINPNPVVQTNNDTAICNGSFVQLNTTGANTYSWTPITNISNPGIGNPTAHPTSLTQYVVTGTISSTGCSAKDSVTITVNQKPTIIKSNDTTICNNASVQLVATGGTGYQWTPAATLTDPTINNPVASPIANTTYDVTITDANNCSNTDSIKVTIRPTPVFTVTPDTLVCSLGAVQLNASGGDIYSWTPSSLVDNPAISDPHAITNTTTTYTVHITESACNVSADLTTKLSLAPPLNITINKANDIDCSNGSSQLLASGADNYTWISGSGLNKNNVPNPIATPLTTQQYVVKGNTADGCVGYDSITVFVNFTDNDNGYYVPSAFTPNGDGLNDCFGIKNWGVLEQFDLSIYNRWGTRIFHTNNQADCWDGTFQEERSDQDTYIYIITATTPCGNVFRKGSLTLIR
jgi:gliding motility-associated-like protein